MIDFKSNQVFFMFGVLVWGIVFWETSDDVSFFCALFGFMNYSNGTEKAKIRVLSSIFSTSPSSLAE